MRYLIIIPFLFLYCSNNPPQDEDSILNEPHIKSYTTVSPLIMDPDFVERCQAKINYFNSPAFHRAEARNDQVSISTELQDFKEAGSLLSEYFSSMSQEDKKAYSELKKLLKSIQKIDLPILRTNYLLFLKDSLRQVNIDVTGDNKTISFISLVFKNEKEIKLCYQKYYSILKQLRFRSASFHSLNNYSTEFYINSINDDNLSMN